LKSQITAWKLLASFIKPSGFLRGFGIIRTNGSFILISKYLEPGSTLILNFLKPEATGIDKINELPDPGIDWCWAVLYYHEELPVPSIKKIELLRFQFHI
jgi:hypothetical protein